MKRHYLIVRVCLIVMIGFLLALPLSCGRPRGRVHVYSGIDASISFRDFLEGSTAEECDFDARLEPEDKLTVYRVDCDSNEIFDGLAPENAASLAATLTDQLKPLPRYPGTFPAQFFAAVAKRSDTEHDPFIVFYHSDSDQDDWSAASKTALYAAAQKLAANHCLYVVFWGIKSSNRQAMRDAFAPLGEDRVLVYGTEDVDTDSLLARLNQARR